MSAIIKPSDGACLMQQI